MGASAGTLYLEMADLAKKVTLTVEIIGMRQYKMRMKIGSAIIRLGVWVTGMKCEIKTDK